MRDKIFRPTHARTFNVENFKASLPRMSWSLRNTYAHWLRQFTPLRYVLDKNEYVNTLPWRRFQAKKLTRAYHGDYINEKIFKRWYLPDTLPDVRSEALVGVQAAAKDVALERWAMKNSGRERLLEKERRKGIAPVGSLMWAEIERRIDIVIFRACFASSVYEARRMVIHGDVLLNGKKHTDANTRLAPGDLVSVDPKAIRFLQPGARREVKEEDEDASEEVESEASAAAEGEATETEKVAAEEKPSKWESKSERELRNADPCTPISGPGLTPFRLPEYAAPHIFVPAYLEPSFATCSVIYLRHPTARPGYSEIPTPYEADGNVMRLAWEWYSKRRMRMRSKKQMARSPENRQ
ncbi:alpha-L RNA-binding motif-containing protein [Epithele typhae]|uniref:alpha-L RNA-binding motif-containing protein n=1 Tax=Epithele typhae TaxID=378194 RepID=UPI0020088688|nr:alpha-L RNA-binding motif-containing protein [Epithele typhae]KAH9915463.1 alpha-L RNA-binding motif-containing protein [Epithele typhae]